MPLPSGASSHQNARPVPYRRRNDAREFDVSRSFHCWVGGPFPHGEGGGEESVQRGPMRRASLSRAAACVLTAVLLSAPAAPRADEAVVPPPLIVPPQPAANAPATNAPAEAGSSQVGTSQAEQPEAEGSAVEEPSETDVPLQQIVIGSAPVAGTFYPAAGAICRQINKRQDLNGLRCLVEETDGSADNLERLREGRLELAIVQSDWAYHAVAGSTSDRAPPMTELRTLALLQPQVMTLVANAGSGILEMGDIAGKRVSVGPPGSGVNEVGRMLLAHLGFAENLTLVELPIEEEASALCSGNIDAFLLPVAHPNGAVAEAVDLCGAVLIDMTGEAVDQLVETWPFYIHATIPAEAYSTAGNSVASFGLVATLVTTTALPDDVAYALTKALFESLDDLRAQHPSLELLTEESMSGISISAPLHEGALLYFQERGWR